MYNILSIATDTGRSHTAVIMQQQTKIAEQTEIDDILGRYWHPLDDGRLQCDVCPRFCRLRDGQRGLCFVR